MDGICTTIYPFKKKRMKELTPYLSKPPSPRTFFAKANEKKKDEERKSTKQWCSGY